MSPFVIVVMSLYAVNSVLSFWINVAIVSYFNKKSAANVVFTDALQVREKKKRDREKV